MSLLHHFAAAVKSNLFSTLVRKFVKNERHPFFFTKPEGREAGLTIVLHIFFLLLSHKETLNLSQNLKKRN